MKIFQDLGVRVDNCAEEIDRRNRKNFLIMSDGALIFAAISFSASLLLPFYRTLAVPHGILFLYSCFLFWAARLCEKKKTGHIRTIMYLCFAPILGMAILLGSFLDPQRSAITIIILLCILPLFIIDKPGRNILYQLLFAGLFVICSYLAKTKNIFQEDMRYFPIYLAYVLGGNYFALADKIESAENYVLVRKEAQHDALTELLNRKSGEEQVKSLLEQNVHGIFTVLDIDNFKTFNDKYGHQAGDDVLCEVAKVMRSVFRTVDVIWRLGGDEFAVYAVNMNDEEAYVKRFAELLMKQEAVEISSCERVRVSISAGCTICAAEQTDYEKAYQISDQALYMAKKSGRGKIIFM